MSRIVKYTTDALGVIPHLLQIYQEPMYGTLRCIRVERLGFSRVNITAEILPMARRRK